MSPAFTTTSIWTALPHGLTGPPTDPNRRLRLAVSVSLRLGSDPASPAGTRVPLSSFPSDVQNWAQTVAALRFAVEVDQVPTTAASVVSVPRPELWTALFPAATPVQLHDGTVEPLYLRTVSTFPNATLASGLSSGYPQTFGLSPIDPPGKATITQAFSELTAALTSAQAAAPASQLAALALQPASVSDQGQLAAAQADLAAGLLTPSTAGSQAQRLAAITRIAQRLAQLSGDQYTPVIPDRGDLLSAFTQLLAFHRGPAALAAGRSQPAGPADQAPPQPYDIHQAFSMLADYPALLPLLGLVVELQLPPPSPGQWPSAPLEGGTTTPARLRVHPLTASGAPLPGALVPWTAFSLDEPTFATIPQPGPPAETTAGLLNLARPGGGYQLVQIDVDGAGLKTVAATANNGGNGAGLPSIRTAGISLSRLGHGQWLHGRFQAAHDTNTQLLSNAGNVTLFDVDVTRGYRLDIADQAGGTWRSLHQRQGSYAFLAAQGGPITIPHNPPAVGDPPSSDEGHTQAAVVDHPDQSGNPPLYVHESLAHWQGWSLSVPRPGKTVGDQGPTDVPSIPTAQGFQLQASFQAVPGTLPRLRYGHSYLVRARTVDLAGNSLSIQEADDLLGRLPSFGIPQPVLGAGTSGAAGSGPAPGFRYQRFEPVPAPVLVLRDQCAEGESVDRLVLRSNADEDTAACAVRLRAATSGRLATARTGYLPDAERHVVPPKISHSAAEASGMFDAAFGPSGQPAATYSVALRDGSLEDNSVVDITTGLPVPIPPTTGIDPVTGATITRPSVETIPDSGSAGVTLHHEDSLALPYLPDPLARGAVLFGLLGLSSDQAAVIDPSGTLTVEQTPLGKSTGLPAADVSVLGSMTQVGFGDSWPQRLPFRLRVTEALSPAPPQWDPAARVLTVFLAKSQQCTVRLASFLLDGDLEMLGQWGWLADSLAPQALDQMATTLAAAGALWALTPAHTITLVHAVQQPLKAPVINSMSALRRPGDTSIQLAGVIAVHGASTAKVDLMASWEETTDALNGLGPQTLSFDRHVYEVPIALPSDTAATGFPPATTPPIQPIADYDITADTLNLVADASLFGLQAATKPNGGGNGGSGGLPPLKPPVYTSRQEFGDTKHRRISYSAVATTRFREYFPGEVTSVPGACTASGAPVTVEVPSSARPAAPKVIACVPTNRWTRPAGSFGTRVRHGGGLRILLDRPWFSSGDGELLGIVLAQPANYPPDDRSRPYVSHWGNDPIWQSPSVPALSASQFDSSQFAGSLTLPELAKIGSPAPVGVVGYEVRFDTARLLWYADIQMSTGSSYRPFVRLAVARYQPNSLLGLELSPVVATDLVQLFPDRTVTVTQDPANAALLHLRVDGPAFTATQSCPRPPEIPPDAMLVTGVDPVPALVEVTVEQRIPGVDDEAGWRQPAAADLGVQIAVSSAALATGATGASAPLWEGTVTLPAAFAPGSLRLVIREREHLLTDRLQGYSYQEIVDLDNGRHKRQTTTDQYRPGDGRVVFAEIINL